MDAVTYPHGGVERRLNEKYVAVRPHIVENAAIAKRLLVTWTPGIVILDGSENVHYRATGYHPPEECEHMLDIAHGIWNLDRGQHRDASHDFLCVVEDDHRTVLEPEAFYWLGVTQHKSGDKDGMLRTWNRLIDAYPETIWAKRAGFIRPQAVAA